MRQKRDTSNFMNCCTKKLFISPLDWSSINSWKWYCVYRLSQLFKYFGEIFNKFTSHSSVPMTLDIFEASITYLIEHNPDMEIFLGQFFFPGPPGAPRKILPDSGLLPALSQLVTGSKPAAGGTSTPRGPGARAPPLAGPGPSGD